MKKQLALLMLLLIFGVAHSQSIEKQVFASSGNELLNANNQLNFTIGESLVRTVSSSSNSVEQGFWKSAAQITLSTTDFSNQTINLVVFPNPVTDYLNIKFFEDSSSNYIAEVFDITGRKQMANINLNSQNENFINFTNTASGQYIVLITDTTLNKKITYKIIKK